jgi:GAF domain-containing protein
VIKPEKPADEPARLQALHQLNILDTPLDPVLERITRLTKKMLDVPIVTISLIDSDRQWFKSEQGLDVCQTDRDISFCAHAILQDEVFVVPNALQDPRFCDNPLVVGEPYIRFYAGYPIRTLDGYKIGTLCIIGHEPHNITPEEIETIKDMATLVEDHLNSQQQKQYQSKIMCELDQAKREKMIDALTRIWNRAGIEMNFREHADIAKNNNNYLALTMIDIDNFKHINDTYGHNAGDEVLREVTKRIMSALNDRDTLGRWGGRRVSGYYSYAM